MVVLNRSESRALFGNKEKGAGNRRFEWADVTLSEVVINVFFQSKGFNRSEAVNATFLHSGIRFQVNSMVPRLVLWETLEGLFIKDRLVFLELGRDSLKGRIHMGFICQGGGMCGICL